MNPVEHVFNQVGHGLKVAGEDTLKAVAWLPSHLAQAEAVVAEAIKQEPAVKALILELVKQSSALVADAGTDIADKGLDLTQDAKSIADIKAYVDYLQTIFFPQIVAIYKDAQALLAK